MPQHFMNKTKHRETLYQYILGYRAMPILKANPSMGGYTSVGIKDFINFLLGRRSYIRIILDK